MASLRDMRAHQKIHPSLHAIRAENKIDILPRAYKWLVETANIEALALSNMACRDGDFRTRKAILYIQRGQN